MAKYRLLREALARDSRFSFEAAPFAPVELIAQVHDPASVRAVLDGTLDPRVIRRIGFPWSEALVSRTLASVGGTVNAARDAMKFGWGGNLAGGTHHAFRDEGSGFCVFHDIAVAIRALGTPRTSVVDLDVHQGDGTAALFADEPRVFTLSLHGRDNFPFRKQVSRVDVGLPDGTGDDAYLAALADVLPMAFEEFGPEIVFFQSGVDALGSDKLGRLALTHEGLKARDRMVFEACRRLGVPLVVTLGGGYSDPVSLTVEAHRNTFVGAADFYSK